MRPKLPSHHCYYHH